MTLKRALMVLVLTVLAALAGCGGGQGDNGPAVDPGLGPITYVVTGVTVDGDRHTLVAGTQVRIRFADGKVTLTAGCNTMSGGYHLEESRLTVEPLAMTEMGCDRARMDQDTWLAGLFAKPVLLTTGTEPSIVSGSTVLAMADREQVSPDLPLEGTRWILETVIVGDVASSVPTGTKATLQISGGKVTVNDGCNGGSGPVKVVGDTLEFGDLMMSMRPCPTWLGYDAGAFSAVISGTATFSIEEHSLTITKGARGLGFRADS